MAFKGDFKNEKRKDFVRRNEQIRVPQVLVVEDGRKVGVMATSIALAKAREVGLDLVEVAAQARPPVCQIMDSSCLRSRRKRRTSRTTLKKRRKFPSDM